MVTKIGTNRADRTNRTSKKRSSKTQNQPNRDRIISLEEIESFGAIEVKKAYISELNGSVFYKDTKAKGVIKLFEAGDKGEQLRAMANFIACSLCREDGEGIYTDENHVLESLTPPSIDAISLGIVQARNESQGND